LLLFGPRRLPELGDAIGKAIRSFKKAHEEPPAQAQETLPPKEGTPGAGASPAPSQASTCPQCHKEYSGEFAFCPSCGHKLKA
jgi:Sec-independent protein translocase protein TatA